MALCVFLYSIYVFAPQNVQLVNDVQTTFLQLQAECEKLNESNTCLHEDNRRKQSHIEVDVLFWLTITARWCWNLSKYNKSPSNRLEKSLKTRGKSKEKA